jgi:hypothetical protein
MGTAIFGFAIAALILASGCAHALLGWPAMAGSLIAQSVDGDLTGALAAGWYFGSASMLAFASIVAAQAVRRLRGAHVDVGALSSIAAAYVLFGTMAFVLRDFRPHFLLFIVTGMLVAAFAFLAALTRIVRAIAEQRSNVSADSR